MEAVESGPVGQCPSGLVYLETVMSRSLDPKPSCHITDGPPLVPDVFPGDAAENAAMATLSTLMGFASISTDLHLPAMPAMSSSLGAKPGQVELTVSGYLIGFSVGQLLWGPVGDRHGRRFPIAIGLVFFIVGSAGCAIAGSVEAMIAWRVVQAAGACAGVVLARTMVRDLYARECAAQMMSTLMTVMAITGTVRPRANTQVFVLAGDLLVLNAGWCCHVDRCMGTP
jgi:MFS family permease